MESCFSCELTWSNIVSKWIAFCDEQEIRCMLPPKKFCGSTIDWAPFWTQSQDWGPTATVSV